MGPLISRLKAGRARVSRLPGQPCKSGGEGLQSGKTTQSPVLSLTAGVADPEGTWGLISRLQLLWAATKSEVKLAVTQACTATQPRRGTQPPKVAGARRCPWLCLNPKLLYVDGLEFVFFLLFINVTEERHVVPFDFLYKSFFRTPIALHE